MDGYMTLLNECVQDEMYANDTFTNINACLESLIAEANEDLNFEYTISVTEAEIEAGSIKDKAAKLSEFGKKKREALKKSIDKFIENLKESVKRFIAKAKAVIAQGGNETMKKLLQNSKAVIAKEIKVTGIKGGNNTKIKNLVDKLGDAVVEVSDNAKNIDNILAGEYVTSLSTTLDALEAVKTRLSDSDVIDKTVKVPALTTVKEAYNDHVKVFTDAINVSKVDGYIKGVVTALNAAKSALDDDNKVNGIDMLNSWRMKVTKLSTGYLTLCFDVLTIAVKNSAKIALAAKSENGALKATVKADEKEAKKAEKEAKKTEKEAK